MREHTVRGYAEEGRLRHYEVAPIENDFWRFYLLTPYELTMVQLDSGAEFAIGYDIIELVQPELIVLRSDPMPEMGMHEPTITRIDLHDHGAKTHMTITDGPYPAGGGHAETGWNAALEKLATLIAG
jgi:hypothetical protein